MTYQVLARKWRPRSFKEMAGQGHVLKTLINSLDNNRLHHAYLFTGTRGVGKTTIARILARCLNCEEGVSSEPCGQCGACREIDEGRFIDLIEVDAASRTKVEDTRELLDNVQYAPSRGRFKVYLIDEVHMLSGHSFNALLKTLEEPPPHVKFLLATTDPQKLPITVLSRCLQFSLKNLSPERLMEHTRFVLDQEKIAYEEPALWQIGRAAQGSVRDALTLLDQAIAFCDSNVTDKAVSAFLGSIDQAIIHRLMDALIAQNAKEMLDIIDEAADHGPDFSAVLAELLSYLHRVAIAQVVPAGVDNSQGDRANILAHAKSVPAENIQLYYQIALKGRAELPLAVDARSGIEMSLLRMLAFTPEGMPNQPMQALPTAELECNNSDESQLKKKPVAPEVSATLDVDLPPPVITNYAEPEPEPEPASQIPEESIQVVDDIQLSGLTVSDWIPLFYKLELSGITRSIAANCVLRSVNKNCIEIALEESQSSVYNDEHKRRIQQSLSDYFQTPITLNVETGLIEEETPAQYRHRKEAERLQKAQASFDADDNVTGIVERFSGIVQIDSIEPLTDKEY